MIWLQNLIYLSDKSSFIFFKILNLFILTNFITIKYLIITILILIFHYNLLTICINFFEIYSLMRII